MFTKKNVFVFFCFFTFIFIIIFLIKYNNNLDNNKNPINNKKNVILGYIYNYSWETMRNYFISLLKADIKNTDIVMFVKQIPEETLEKIKSFGVITYPIPDNSPYPPNTQRYVLYGKFLSENKDKYNMALHADVRDTIFQKDVFEVYKDYKSFLALSIEDLFLTDEANRNWLLEICNETIFNKYLSDKHAICAGLILGSVDKFIELTNEILKRAEKKRNAIEQAVINYMIYYEKVFSDCIIMKTNKDGNILTIGAVDRNKINLDNENNILNFENKVAGAVHQYDRLEDIKQKMNQKFDDSNFNYTYFKEEREKINIKKYNKNYFSTITISIISIIIVIIFISFLVKIILQKSKNEFEKVKILKKIKKNKKRYVYIKI